MTDPTQTRADDEVLDEILEQMQGDTISEYVSNKPEYQVVADQAKAAIAAHYAAKEELAKLQAQETAYRTLWAYDTDSMLEMREHFGQKVAATNALINKLQKEAK